MAKQSDSDGGAGLFDINCHCATAGTNTACSSPAAGGPACIYAGFRYATKIAAEITRDVTTATDIQPRFFTKTSRRGFGRASPCGRHFTPKVGLLALDSRKKDLALKSMAQIRVVLRWFY